MLTAPDRSRLAKVCGLFGSDHAGERASAAQRADRMVRRAGLTWEQILEPAQQRPPRIIPDDHQRRARWILDQHADQLTAREYAFLRNVTALARLSAKQAKWLNNIREAVALGAAA